MINLTIIASGQFGKEFITELVNFANSRDAVYATTYPSLPKKNSNKENEIIFYFIKGIKDLTKNKEISSIKENIFLVFKNLESASSKELKSLGELIQKNNNIQGIMDLRFPFGIHLPSIENVLLKIFYEKEFNKLSTLEKSVIRSSEELKEEMIQMEDLHQKLLPIKENVLKGIKFYYKYRAGIKPFPEFINFLQDSRIVYYFMSAHKSYLASSDMIEDFIKLKGEKNIGWESIDLFIQENIKRADTPDDFQYMVFSLDTKTLEINIHSLGDFKFFVNDKSLEKKDFKYPIKLKAKDRVLVIGPGFFKNNESTYHVLLNNISKDRDVNPEKFINELFFSIQKDSDKDFLRYDSTVLLIQVDTHVLYEV